MHIFPTPLASTKTIYYYYQNPWPLLHVITYFQLMVSYLYAILWLFWRWSPYLDLWWRSCSTGTIPDLLITSIVRHENMNRWWGDPLWRSCSLFCVVIFHLSFGLVKYHYKKQFTCSCYTLDVSATICRYQHLHNCVL